MSDDREPMPLDDALRILLKVPQQGDPCNDATADGDDVLDPDEQDADK